MTVMGGIRMCRCVPVTGRLPAQAVGNAARCQRLGLGPACGLDTGPILGTAPGTHGRWVLERGLDVVLVIQRQGRVPVGRITGRPALAERARILAVKAGRTGGQILFKLAANSLAETGSFLVPRTAPLLFTALALYGLITIAWIWGM